MTFPAPPKTLPRCGCFAPSKWCWDPYDEEWYQCICWRCLEIKAMKNPDDYILQSMLPWTEETKERFIELVTSETKFLKTVTVKEFKR